MTRIVYLKKGNALASGHTVILGIMLYLHYLSAAFLPLPHVDIETTLTANPNSKPFLREHVFCWLYPELLHSSFPDFSPWLEGCSRYPSYFSYVFYGKAKHLGYLTLGHGVLRSQFPAVKPAGAGSTMVTNHGVGSHLWEEIGAGKRPLTSQLSCLEALIQKLAREFLAAAVIPWRSFYCCAKDRCWRATKRTGLTWWEGQAPLGASGREVSCSPWSQGCLRDTKIKAH